MKKKYEETSPEVLKAKEIGEKQFLALCNAESDSFEICFENNGLEVCNPFMEPTGRFELSLENAYEVYGIDNVNNFIEACNKQSHASH